MILIVSDTDDLSLSQLEQESKYSNVFRVLRYDTYLLDNFQSLTISDLENNIVFNINNEKFTLKDFDLVWYKQFSYNQSIKMSIGEIENLTEFYRSELKNLHYYFHYKIYECCRTINSPFKGITNKLQQLDVFKRCGFKIPATNIYTGGVDLDFRGKQFITKGISVPPQSKVEGKLKIGYTSVVDVLHKDYLLQEKYFPTLIQEKINCQSELRVFFFLNKIYAINILVDRKNFVDYRSTNYSQEYNAFPVELSEELEDRIRKVMNALDLDSGSIDILIDEKDDCILLEVNKYGQFGMINDSSPNYMLKLVINKIIDTIKSEFAL